MLGHLCERFVRCSSLGLRNVSIVFIMTSKAMHIPLYLLNPYPLRLYFPFPYRSV